MADYANRAEREARLARAIAKLGTRNRLELLRIMGDPPKLENLPPEYWGERFSEWQKLLSPELEDIFVDSAKLMLDQPRFTSIGVDWDLINQDAADWARQYSGDLVKGITDTTKEGVRRAVGDYYEQGWDLSQLKQKLGRWYSPTRAEMIAVTEVTRSSVEGEMAVVKELANEGIEMTTIWQTANDELVCPVCGPRHGKRKGDGWFDPPPAHPRCRCGVTHEFATVDNANDNS